MKIKSIIKQGCNILHILNSTNPWAGPLKIQWAVTYNCNSRCRFCECWKRYKDKFDDELTTEDGIKLIDQLIDLDTISISFTGGEPLLREDIFKLITYASERGILHTTISTNGLLLDKYSDKLINSGLTAIYVSMDSADAETYRDIRGVDAFDKVISSVKKILNERNNKRKPKVLFNITMNNYNIDQIPRIIELGREIGLDGITLQPVHDSPRDHLTIHEESIRIPKENILKVEQVIKNCSKEIGSFLKHPEGYYNKFPIFFAKPEALKKIRCFAGLVIAHIDAYGNVYPCEEKFAKFGNIREKSLREIWFSDNADSIRNRIKKGDHPICWYNCYGPINIELSNFKKRPIKTIRYAFDRLGIL
ncbi:MAG: hypothetical protein DRO95_00130 [Candidatus Altiarchaeales archaeon]|nr:MAG: hypothetical protein DRO95_00130 [Candidatus Altiarchaeales archaeon]HDO82791.1 radical SAM protein [Candidatus Altiarchaeales archaeon]HEX55440.1 radical SAM protein [Candidatus Altiarchaeales archaeon]